jgi:hypothetical protein
MNAVPSVDFWEATAHAKTGFSILSFAKRIIVEE